ncbi:MAG TPA: calcium-binding EGF-like domain-containing protein, partial [Kofleriaceae bacterium]|nr:calcium-binding EGF-like domain-containing protein [Kofleriaceae bacterium]
CCEGLASVGGTCTDVDECATPGQCSGNASCANTPGSFSCACNPGYAGDGFTCNDVDECATANGGCSASATCTNTPGGHTCTCNGGYTGDGATCSDIDECATANGGCSVNATCTNTAGGHTCTCNSGYGGDGYTCASNAPVTQYYGTRIGNVGGFATFTGFNYVTTAAITDGLMEFWMYGQDASPYSGCNGDGYAYYSNGGGVAATRVRRTNGAEFGSLEFVAADGWGQCYNYGYVELYKAGVLQGAFDIEGHANSTVYGFTGSFDEVRVAFYQTAAQRNTHSFSTYNAGLIDHVTFGTP